MDTPKCGTTTMVTTPIIYLVAMVIGVSVPSLWCPGFKQQTHNQHTDIAK